MCLQNFKSSFVGHPRIPISGSTWSIPKASLSFGDFSSLSFHRSRESSIWGGLDTSTGVRSSSSTQNLLTMGNLGTLGERTPNENNKPAKSPLDHRSDLKINHQGEGDSIQPKGISGPPRYMTPTMASRSQVCTPQSRDATPTSLSSSVTRGRGWVTSAAKRVGLVSSTRKPAKDTKSPRKSKQSLASVQVRSILSGLSYISELNVAFQKASNARSTSAGNTNKATSRPHPSASKKVLAAKTTSYRDENKSSTSSVCPQCYGG